MFAEWSVHWSFKSLATLVNSKLAPVMENNYCSFYSVKKLLESISKFCQVKKSETKKYVIRITAIGVQKGSKNTSFTKTSRSPHYFSH